MSNAVHFCRKCAFERPAGICMRQRESHWLYSKPQAPLFERFRFTAKLKFESIAILAGSWATICRLLCRSRPPAIPWFIIPIFVGIAVDESFPRGHSPMSVEEIGKTFEPASANGNPATAIVEPGSVSLDSCIALSSHSKSEKFWCRHFSLPREWCYVSPVSAIVSRIRHPQLTVAPRLREDV